MEWLCGKGGKTEDAEKQDYIDVDMVVKPVQCIAAHSLLDHNHNSH
jgi:hypothetical protein